MTPFFTPILAEDYYPQVVPGDPTLLAHLVFLNVIQKKKSDRNCPYSKTPWAHPGGMLSGYELREDPLHLQERSGAYLSLYFTTTCAHTHA